MPITLCDRHFAILRFLREFRAERGYSASIREISAGLENVSTSMISFYLAGLESAGLVTRNPRIARSIVLTEQGEVESYRELPRNTVIPIRLFSDKGV